MLSDAEQRRLAEIELSLQTEDPLFVKRFNDRSRSRRATICGMTGRGWLIMSALIMCLAVLMLSAWMAALAASVAGAGAILWLVDCCRLRPRKRPARP